MAEEPTELAQRVDEAADRLGYYLEKTQLADYIQLLEKPRRLLWLNFLGGLGRGVGFAVGGTLIGALIFYGLMQLARMNLPLIGNFIAGIVRIVEYRLGY